jgi:predicted O-linked N-acetylglucosamine transferase (SPINDLY family)
MLSSLFDSVVRGARLRRTVREAAEALEVGASARARSLLEPAYRAAPGDAYLSLLLGRALVECDELGPGFALLDRAVRLAPELVEARVHLGRQLQLAGRIEDTLVHLNAAVAAAPESPVARRALIYPLLETCDWAAVDRERELLVERARRDPRWTEFVTPMDALLLGLPAAQRRAVAEAKAADIERAERRQAVRAARIERRGRKLKIGYVSGDFRDHAVAHLAAHMFRRHDRDRFEVYAFSYGRDDGSPYRREVAEGVDRFADVRQRPNAEVAREIAAAGVDILVDLSGHTGGSRLGILAHRPAPVQVHYLGYPGTTGARFLDYFIADRVVASPAMADKFTEHFVMLPDCFMVSDPGVADAPPASRAEHGLPQDAFVYCNFNQNSRIDEAAWKVWMEILRAVPRAVLWLKLSNAPGRDHLQRAAAAADVDPARLIFAPDVPGKLEHIARLRLADLVLDTFGRYNGHTSTADALWAGVPVVTMASDCFPGRVAASLLAAGGMRVCVTQDIASYKETTIGCALDAQRLASLRDALARARGDAPFFKPERVVRNLERAYSAMWARFTEGLEPAEIDVAAASRVR